MNSNAAYEALYQKNIEQQEKNRAAYKVRMAMKKQQEEQQERNQKKRMNNLRILSRRPGFHDPSQNLPPLNNVPPAGGKHRTQRQKRRHARKHKSRRHH